MISRVVETVNKILPTPLTFQGNDDAENLNLVLDNFDNHFESLLKITEDKSEKRYLEKKLKEVFQSISWDLGILKATTIKAKNYMAQGRKLYSYCINPSRHK